MGFVLGKIEGKIAHVLLLAVHPKYWRQGIGSALLRSLEQLAIKMGASEIRLGTPFAKGFYEKLGYRCYQIRYRLIKELTYSNISIIDSKLESITFSDLREIARILNEREFIQFLEKYVETLEPHQGLAFKLCREGNIVGVAILQNNKWNKELLEVKYLYGHNVKEKRELIAQLLIEASKRGYRWLGLEAEEKLAQELLKEGWKEAHLPEFWTMYMLRKPLK